MENNINLMKFKVWYLVFSAVVLIPGMFFLFRFGLRMSIDFTGGSDLKYENLENVGESEIHKVFSENGAVVEGIRRDGGVTIIRTKPINSGQIDLIKSATDEAFNNPKLLSFETVGPSIGKETTKNAFVALFWASLGILLYIAYAFRNIPKPYSSLRFGISAVIAMLHDAFVVLGIFAILSYFFHTEIDALFITAILTVIGFSVHDTIVVFDRIRENLSKLPSSWSFESLVNFSVVETLNRSIATSLTVVMTLLSLYLLGGESIKEFVLAMLIGIVSGTYSSIFNAAPILVLWEEHIIRKRRFK